MFLRKQWWEGICVTLMLGVGVVLLLAYAGVAPFAVERDRQIALENNPRAVDPTWEELKAFLLNDKTDELVYVKDVFMCLDFAELLHANAESAGIKAAIVTIGWVNKDIGHALNAFNTTDRGLVYIDATGSIEGSSDPYPRDKVMEMNIGDINMYQAVFPCEGCTEIGFGIDIVKSIDVQW